MASLKLVTKKRNGLYFNQYKYSVTFPFSGATYFSAYKKNDLDDFIEILKLKNSTGKTAVQVMSNDWKPYWENIDIDVASKFVNWVNSIDQSQVRLLFRRNDVTVYSNNLSILQTVELFNKDCVIVELTVMQVDKNKLYFKRQPKYKYRTYFRSKKLPKDFTESVHTLQDNHDKTEVKFSDSLLKSLFFHTTYHPYRYLYGKAYVDYNSKSFLSILHIHFPTMLGKSYSLEKES
jgi:hypothetical protein